MPQPAFFETPAAWRAWLKANHQGATEIFVGFWKAGTGKPSITWPESVDEALCFGWIDGVRRRIDDDSYCIRFTPRRRGSIWSAVNIRKVAELQASGRMTEAGLAVFEAGRENTGRYSFENRDAKLSEAEAAQFQMQAPAWAHFQTRPASYRHAAVWWVVSAKRTETRDRRLASLIEVCTAGDDLPHLKRRSGGS
ncbi:YdeI/OmpD-associated family protein [Phenylobacterium deserti]|uniref:Bacteriocin-protection protein n=1 Tax=Phenylobacterium deserti TaxID=1914756 RepID=A0A328ATH2_9CAUL|nr:YdeI/OmpD-associated family protein [Phenylobacterium deserti]RAK56794.1 bacteriocin-protection protein [Phenylobacterium deserti]